MKQKVKYFGIFITILMMYSNLFAIAGIGLYGNYDMFSYPTQLDDQNGLTVNSDSFDNAFGVSGFIYVDFLPIDIELSGEKVGNVYNFQTDPGIKPGKFPWGRTSVYGTIRKKVIGLGIPLLAKAQLNVGGGVNGHWVTPPLTVGFFEEAFGVVAENALEQDFSSTSRVKTLADYVKENYKEAIGFHVQAGIQAKVLVMNLFVTARYTLAKDVIKDASGFPSFWVGIAYGI